MDTCSFVRWMDISWGNLCMCIQPTRLPGIHSMQFDNWAGLTSMLLVRKAKKGNQEEATQKSALRALHALRGNYHVPFIPFLFLPIMTLAVSESFSRGTRK